MARRRAVWSGRTVIVRAPRPVDREAAERKTQLQRGKATMADMADLVAFSLDAIEELGRQLADISDEIERLEALVRPRPDAAPRDRLRTT